MRLVKKVKTNKLGRRIQSFVLTVALMVELMPGNVMTVRAEESSSTKLSVTAFATPEQLMSSDNFALHTDYTGVAQKVYFGTNGGRQQTWYIAGSDAADSIVLLCDPLLPMATGTMFENDDNNKTYSADWSCTYGTDPSEVYPNHYGASDLRGVLQGYTSNDNTEKFSAAEKELMLATKIYTDDVKRKKEDETDYTYYTEDVLYPAYGDTDMKNNHRYITVGTNSADSLNGGLKVSLISAPYNSGEKFWLRAPKYDNRVAALYAIPASFVSSDRVNREFLVVSAFRLNLSSVLFASAATAAIFDTAESGVIAKGSAMTLRLDGSNSGSTIAIGEVLYDADKGLILAKKDASAQAVALVVQGNDGTKDWYYSKTIDGTEWISTTDIGSALSITDISLLDCKIWLETTDATSSSLRYAVMAETGTFIDSVAITDIDTPVGGTALDTSAVSATAGLAKTDLTVAWTKDGEAAGETADYDTTYTAGITLTSAEKAAFVSGATATVNGNAATVTPNTDGTVTVTYDFTTEKRKLVSIAAPAVPENNRFTSEYTAENVLASTELGTTVQVTLEGTTEPVTVDMAVEWSLANDNNAEYDTTSSATNTFKWTVKGDAYDEYDTNDVTLEGTVDIKNACTEHMDEDTDGKCDTCSKYMDNIGARLVGHSLTLDGSVGVNFYMELSSEVRSDSSAYMEFTLPGGKTSTVKVSEAPTEVISGTTYYKFKCQVNATAMTDTITAQIKSTVGNSKVYEYTVKEYADYLFEHKNENTEFAKAAALIEAMVNYGSYAQIYAGYNTEKLAVGDVNNLKSLDDVGISEYYEPSIYETKVQFAGANLSLLSTTTLRMYFQLIDVEANEVQFGYQGQLLEMKQSGDYYYVELVGIPASKLDDEFRIDVLGGSTNFVVTYTPMAYCTSVVHRETTETRTEDLKNLIKALVLYNRAADAYISED